MTKRPISKAFIILSLFAILLLGFSTSGFSTIYYVNTAADAGGDGTTQELTGEHCAFKTIAQVNAASPAAGSSILFNKGNEWREQLTVPTSGSDGSPITYGAYGDGADPIINGADLVETWTATGSWQTAWNPAPISKFPFGVARNYRNVLPANTSSYSGTKLRITCKAHADGEGVIDGSSIGIMTTDDDFDSTPTRITWADGGDGITISASGTCVSDEINFTFTKTNRYGLHFYLKDRGYLLYDGATGVGQWQDDGVADDTLSQSVAYTEWASETNVIDKVEVYTGTTNVWQATLATEPKVIFVDGVLGSHKASAVACTSANDWFWGANVLYLYSTVDPDGNKVVEAGKRDYAIAIDSTDDYVNVENIECRGANVNGIYFDGDYNEITDCTVRFCYVGMRQYGTATNTTITDTTVQNCRYRGIRCGGSGKVIIDGCTIHNILEDQGIIVLGDDSEIKNCAIYDIAEEGATFGQHHALYAAKGSDNITIENNEIYDTYNGHCIACKSDNATIRYNHIHDSRDAGIIIDDQASGGTINIYYNIINGCSFGMFLYDYNFHASTNVNIYNNVFYDNTRAIAEDEPKDLYIQVDVNALNIKNNIFHRPTMAWMFHVVTQTGMTCDYNCCYRTAGTYFGSYGGATQAAFSDWQTATSGDANSFNSDPLMTDPANDDFHLNPHSPCVNAGTDVSLTEDYEGLKIRHAPDIGAHENQANVLFFSWFLRDFLGVNK